MIEINGNNLQASFPEVHENATCQVTFQRTLRVPDDGKEYPLPAGLGSFPIFSVDDHNVSAEWKKHGGVFLPMYQAEAMWLNFNVFSKYPFALKISAGKVNAVSGSLWSNELNGSPQDYVVIPEQNWIDGFYVAKGTVKQFVAAPLGSGITVEEQVTGKAEFGGVQLLFVPMKKDFYHANIEVPEAIALELSDLQLKIREGFRDLEPLIERAEERMGRLAGRLDTNAKLIDSAPATRHWQSAKSAAQDAKSTLKQAEKLRKLWEKSFVPFRRGRTPGMSGGEWWSHMLGSVDYCEMSHETFDMGLGAGGQIRQEIAADPWGIEAWDMTHTSRCFVHLVNSAHFQALTGKNPPTQPISAAEYEEAGIPWFDYYLEGDVLGGSDVLAKVKSMAKIMTKHGDTLPDNKPIRVSETIDLYGQNNGLIVRTEVIDDETSPNDDFPSELRNWIGNDENNRSHHGAIPLKLTAVDLHLSWKEAADAKVKEIGCFRLNLTSLLEQGYIRRDGKENVRLRFVHADDGCIYIQQRKGTPRMLVGRFK